MSIEIKSATVSRLELMDMYMTIMVNYEGDLSSNEAIAIALNREFGDRFDGTVTAEQLEGIDIDIISY